MIYKLCMWYIWRAARQDKTPKMTPANNYGISAQHNKPTPVKYATPLPSLKVYPALNNRSVCLHL